ncbi:hypothetical protein BCR44DRAFT_1482373 [Catenaria anguillulae PL171]|uniref:Uncharacterized protein n=1 Tax=Catenaria anguillulae PL171 TaxID=765915 RepID=A0A1Y2HYL1_9FUNG|nr:hypothetical protein BCR44DRAFT_1482373 [Catenaria anguillulae PL171]
MLAIPSAGAAAFAKQHAGPSISSSPSLPAALDPPVPASHKSLPRTRREGSITPCTFKGHHRLSILSASAPPSVHEAIMNLKVPSPIILTISLYVFLFVHVPLITKLAITKAFSQNWDQAVREHTLLWSAWAVWLALFGISAIVYGVQLMSVLAANEADRMESNALKGQLVSTTVGAQAANMAVAESSPAASMASHATSGTLGRTGRTSNSRDSGSPGSGPERAAAPPVKSATSPAVIDPLEAQRKLALAQVRSIVVTAPVFALVYSAIDVLNVFAYRALQQDPQVIETWLWIVPAAMHILAQGLAHADAFVGLSLVIWRERKESKIRLHRPCAPPPYMSEAGFGNFGVTITGYDASTVGIQYVAHCIGLGMASAALPLAVYVTYNQFWVRRRPLFTKRKDRPQPSESLAICFAFATLATASWHLCSSQTRVHLWFDPLAHELCIGFSSLGLLLHLVGVMRAIPVSSTKSMFVRKGSRLQSLLFRLRVPSPGILTAVVYFYSFIHVPLATVLALRFGTVTNWAAMFLNFYAHWGQWTLWLSLFSITATLLDGRHNRRWRAVQIFVRVASIQVNEHPAKSHSRNCNGSYQILEQQQLTRDFSSPIHVLESTAYRNSTRNTTSSNSNSD